MTLYAAKRGHTLFFILTKRFNFVGLHTDIVGELKPDYFPMECSIIVICGSLDRSNVTCILRECWNC